MDLKIQNQFFPPKFVFLNMDVAQQHRAWQHVQGPIFDQQHCKRKSQLSRHVFLLCYGAAFPVITDFKKNFHEEKNHVFKFLSALCISNCVHNIGSAIKAKKKYTQGVINLITEFCDVALKCVPYKWDFSFNLKVQGISFNDYLQVVD